MSNQSEDKELKTLLAVFAHPDDEILGPGGTLARYSAEGVRTVLVVATRGEAGEIQRPGTATPETLPEVREAEMRCAADDLGINELIFLGYRDSGMRGTEDNEHPNALINAPHDEVVPRLVGLIRRFQPQVVLTFEPFGGYGHPDHIATHHHTTAAFTAASNPVEYPVRGLAWQPDRLFFPLLPPTLFQEMKKRVAARGGDTTRFDEWLENRQQAPEAWPADLFHARLDVSDYTTAKWKAWNCHRSQFGPNSRFRQLPEDEMMELLSVEYFGLGYPQVPEDYLLEDLFQDL